MVLIKSRQKVTGINRHKIRSDSEKALLLLGLGRAELSIFLVDDKKMRSLNSRYRSKDKTTDVLSFPQYSQKVQKSKSSKGTSALRRCGASALLLGDIVINIQAAKRQSLEHGLSFREELRWLLVHGILHLIGYDHEKSGYADRQMRNKEREMLLRLS